MSISSLRPAVMWITPLKVSMLVGGGKGMVVGICRNGLHRKRPEAAPCWTQLVPTDPWWSRYQHCSPWDSPRWSRRIFLKKLWSVDCPHQRRGETWGGGSCSMYWLQLPTHPPKPCGIRVGELGVKSSLGQQGGKAIIDNKLIFPSRVSFAHNGNWWVLSPSLSQPRSFLILFFPPIPLRQGSEWVAWWAPGCEQELTWQSVSLGKKTTYEPSSKTLLSQTFHLNFKGMHTHEFENKWNILYL